MVRNFRTIFSERVIRARSEPDGSRALLGALLLGYYTPDGRLLYAGRVGTGMSEKTLRMQHSRLAPLVAPKMPLADAAQDPFRRNAGAFQGSLG